MRRVVGAFDDAGDAAAARGALRQAAFEPREPDVDNPFFDPTARLPEERGLGWGGLLGAPVGALLLLGLDQGVFWVPRVSPLLTAGTVALVFLGAGLGGVVGGVLGGVVGTYRQVPERADHRVAVAVADDRVGEARDLLWTHGAAAVEDTVTHHEHPRRERVGG